MNDSIFQTIVDKNPEFLPLFQKKAIIAYSGGKDSAILVEFYKFLYQNKITEKPVLFHLDHSIRNNATQEKEIANFMQSLGWESFCKKKIFYFSPNF